MRHSKEKQTMSLQVTPELSVTITKSKDFEFTLPTKEVDKGYGVHTSTVNRHKKEHSDELIEGKHYVYGVQNLNSAKMPVLHWTKAGVIRLGFFIKSERAKLFRTWAENLILDKLDRNPAGFQNPQGLPQTVNIKIVNAQKVSVIITEEQEWYKLRDLFPVFGYRTSNTTHLLKRLPKNTYRQLQTHINGNQTEWYVNREGVVNFMFSAQKSIPVSVVDAVQVQLFERQIPKLPKKKEVLNIFMNLMEVEPPRLRKTLTERVMNLINLGGEVMKSNIETYQEALQAISDFTNIGEKENLLDTIDRILEINIKSGIAEEYQLTAELGLLYDVKYLINKLPFSHAR